ncbi:hypothetical protein C9374_012770 [Naegleria lovaniensis]|uniref:Small-subunit processome Utp12 domain-containing protein n=1 Tax=Naegleria lovaniensis TaxID=51637 RepID=A0AA88GE42_NAELO|nr:uncharacterized protein C9374_012770 [Naegleria lovaniensis]KAG2373168.1 hypothetical protein C9374_012770 [Naegleria lovaniensis]
MQQDSSAPTTSSFGVCWEPNNGGICNFATLSQSKNQINVYSGENSQLLLQLTLPLDLQTKFSCMSWISLTSNLGLGDDEKKRKKSNKSYILAGTMDGKVIAFDTERGRVVKSIQLAPASSGSPILNVNCPDGNRIFAALSPNLIAGTHFLVKSNNTKVDLNKICFEDITCLSDNCGHLNGADVFAIANAGKTQLFQVNTQQRVCDFQGHENGAHQTVFIHSDLLLTRSNDDRYLNLYNLSNVMASTHAHGLNTSNFIEQLMSTSSSSSDLIAPNKVLTLDGNVIAIDGFYRSKKYLDILAVSHSGLLTLFRLKPADNSSYEIASKATVKCHQSKGFGKVISAKFIDESRIILAMGSALFPNLQILDYSSNEKDQENFLFTEKELVIDDQPIVAGSKDKLIGSKGGAFSSNIVLGSANMETPNARFAQGFTKSDGQKTFQDILAQQQTTSTKKEMTLSESGVPVMKLNSSLITALKSHDVGMVAKCLSHSDFDLIESTVQNLSATYAIKLLDVIIELYGDFSQTRDTLIYWLRSLLVNHTSHIMSQKDIIERLSPIYHSIDTRLRMLPALMDLSGRLDLLLSIGGYAKVDFATSDNIATANTKSKAKKFTIVDNADDSDEEIVEMIQASYNKKKSRSDEEDDYDVIDDDDAERDDEILKGLEEENKKGWFGDMENDDDLSDEEKRLEELLDKEEQKLKSKGTFTEDEDDDEEHDQDAMQDEDDFEDDE